MLSARETDSSNKFNTSRRSVRLLPLVPFSFFSPSSQRNSMNLNTKCDDFSMGRSAVSLLVPTGSWLHRWMGEPEPKVAAVTSVKCGCCRWPSYFGPQSLGQNKMTSDCTSFSETHRQTHTHTSPQQTSWVNSKVHIHAQDPTSAVPALFLSDATILKLSGA